MYARLVLNILKSDLWNIVQNSTKAEGIKPDQRLTLGSRQYSRNHMWLR